MGNSCQGNSCFHNASRSSSTRHLQLWTDDAADRGSCSLSGESLLATEAQSQALTDKVIRLVTDRSGGLSQGLRACRPLPVPGPAASACYNTSCVADPLYVP